MFYQTAQFYIALFIIVMLVLLLFPLVQSGAVRGVLTYILPGVFPAVSDSNSGGTTEKRIYSLYKYEYLPNVRAGGKTISITQNVTSPLICSNLAAVADGCVGANWSKGTSTCELLSDLMPLRDDPTSTLLILSATEVKNGVSTWAQTEGLDGDGTMFCSNTLAYKEYTRALCAAIPQCGLYTQGFDANNNPVGCVKVQPGAPGTKTSLRMTGATGSRNDGVSYITDAPEGSALYRWSTSVAVGEVGSVIDGTTLSSCGDLVAGQATSVAATWNSSLNGQCTLYTTLERISKDAQSTNMTTIISPTIPGGPQRYSNAWLAVPNADYSANLPMNGTENDFSIDLDTAISLCASNSLCGAVIRVPKTAADGTSQPVYQYRTAESVAAGGFSAPGRTAYVFPVAFQ